MRKITEALLLLFVLASLACSGIAKPGKPGSNMEPKDSDSTYTVVKLHELYNAYQDNEAAADAKYTNKRVQCPCNYLAGYVSNGIEKDTDGTYYIWFSQVDTRTNRHITCYFRKDQTTNLSALQGSNKLTIRGICKGRTGSTRTLAAGVQSDWPTIAIKDCELVK